MRERIVIANASGYWGDEAAAIKRQVLGGPIDYLTMDYLAEITMIILAKQRADSEDLGYARDFVANLGRILGEITERGIRVICNAGGINPGACARALSDEIERQGLELPIAVVDGDDLMPRLGELVREGCELPHIDTGEALGERLDRVTSANAYIGAQPIVAALDRGARVVITGRTYDAASVVAPMVYEFGWSWDDYDKLASGLLAGHLIECGAQATGGNYTLWREVSDYRNMGYPLVEVRADGSFDLTKHPGTGGLVSTRTVIEQALYEIGDPTAYLSPDVAADFTTFSITQSGSNRVSLTGVKGYAPPDSLKVSITYDVGFKVDASVVVSGPDCLAKARRFAEIFWGRVGDDFLERRTDLLGYSACWGESAAPEVEPNEVVLRFAASAASPKPLQAMARELAGIALAGPAGICGAGGRPQVSKAFGFWPALIPADRVTARVSTRDGTTELPCALPNNTKSRRAARKADLSGASPGLAAGPRQKVPLSRISHSRSGDKGDTCNVGIAALRADLYPELLREVTAERVAEFFASNVKGPVTRYRLDNLNALNFVMRSALGGGGTRSLMLDNQGKTIGQALLTMEVEVSQALLEEDL
ncbi:MAG: acyclic terpene utilization AtuA family protein [Candidatus Binatia bacterium]